MSSPNLSKNKKSDWWEECKIDFKDYFHMLKECLGLVLVGAILFAVMEGLSTGCSEHALAVSKDLKEHKAVLLSINHQAYGLGVLFFGVFYALVDSANAKNLAKYIVIPFISFIRDGTAIATGAYAGVLAQEIVMDGKFSELSSTSIWVGCVLVATAVQCAMVKALPNAGVIKKAGWDSTLLGVTCILTGIFWIFYK